MKAVKKTFTVEDVNRLLRKAEKARCPFCYWKPFAKPVKKDVIVGSCWVDVTFWCPHCKTLFNIHLTQF